MTKKCIKCLNSLSTGTRLKIIRHLRKKPQNVSEIEEIFDLTQPTISYHLGVLKKAGLISSTKRGREIYYSFNKKYPCKHCLALNL